MTTTASIPPLVEIRCEGCGKMLCQATNMVNLKIRIKCGRCGIMYDNIK